jgi:signal transduction histidine kinase
MGTRRPRRARTLPVPRGDGRTALFDAQAYPVAGGGLLVLFSEVSQRERQARALAERSAENERLRELARTMAAVDDTPTLLAALCDAAISLTRAAGATVAAVVEDGQGEFVAAANHPDEIRGHRFPLAGTLTGRLLALLQAPDADGDRVPLLRATAAESRDAAYRGDLRDGRHVGSVLLAPLAAHGRMLGVLAVSRADGEAPFTAVDEDRLRVVADHASLALHKASLVEEAQAANSTKSAFLATVSHELRTPLTALTGYGELLADEIAGPLTAGQADIVERMRAVTHQLTGMIEEVLTFSALEAGREVVRPAPVDVAEVVHAVTAVVEPLAATRGLAFRAAVPPLPPPLVTDPDKLRQILVNLAGNAVKFTPAGSVAVEVTADGDAVRFAVADTGVGIADSDLPRLFHAFSQLDRGLTRRYGGTGLGLYISQRLARLLGGRIEVRSAPGAGSTFTLTLPLGEPAGAAQGAPKAADGAATFPP